MATRIYLSRYESSSVTPSTWNFPNAGSQTFKAFTTKQGSASGYTGNTTGTGGLVYKAINRYVYGPLAAQTISGTVKGVVRCYENNSGANASIGLAVKLIKPDTTDRGVLLAYTAPDATAQEMVVNTGTNRQFRDASENTSISLTSQSASDGDYLVIEVGFRASTSVNRTVAVDASDAIGASDCAENETDTAANTPWVEFSQTLALLSSYTASGSLGTVDGTATTAQVGGSTTKTYTASGSLGTAAGTAALAKTKNYTTSGSLGTLTGTAAWAKTKAYAASGSLATFAGTATIAKLKNYVASGSLGVYTGTATVTKAYIHPYTASGSLGTLTGTATAAKVETSLDNWIVRRRNGILGMRRWRTTLIRE